MTKLLIKFKICFNELTSLFYIRFHLHKFSNFFHSGQINANTIKTAYETAKLRLWWESTLSNYREVDFKNQISLPSYKNLNFTNKIMNSSYKRYLYFNQRDNSEKLKREEYSLNGEIEISEIAKNEVKVLINNKIGDSDYIFLGKRIINNYFLPPIYCYFDNKYNKFEFYNIWKLIYWDSNEESLGNYCRKIDMKWSMDDGKNWMNFIPEYPLISNDVLFLK